MVPRGLCEACSPARSWPTGILICFKQMTFCNFGNLKMWVLMGSPGTPWDLVGPRGTSRGPVGPRGSPWDPAGPRGTLTSIGFAPLEAPRARPKVFLLPQEASKSDLWRFLSVFGSFLYIFKKKCEFTFFYFLHFPNKIHIAIFVFSPFSLVVKPNLTNPLRITSTAFLWMLDIGNPGLIIFKAAR